MILVLVGTNPYSFARLVRQVDKLAVDRGWEVFMQLGNTPEEPEHCRFERFIEKDVVIDLIGRADVVITHGGFGSIRDVLAAGKTPVVVPRLQQFSECNDVQLELVRELDELGKVIAVYDIADLEQAIEQVPDFVGGHVAENRIPRIIGDFLREQL